MAIHNINKCRWQRAVEDYLERRDRLDSQDISDRTTFGHFEYSSLLHEIFFNWVKNLRDREL